MEPELLTHLIDRHSAALVLYARQWCAAAQDEGRPISHAEARQSLQTERTGPRRLPPVRAIPSCHPSGQEGVGCQRRPGPGIDREAGEEEALIVADSCRRYFFLPCLDWILPFCN